jgi:hypothetical protein
MRRVGMDTVREGLKWIKLGSRALFTLMVGPRVVSIMDLTSIED